MGLLQPLGEPALLPFVLQLLLLLFVARALGGLMRRMGQPSVVGELGAGLLLGPSIFGRFLPDIAAVVFPGGTEGSFVMAVAQLGILFLLLVTGFETDLTLLRRLGRTSATTAAASLIVPLLGGWWIGMLLPSGFVGGDVSRVTFALFVATAVSISALAVSGRILTELDLMRRDVGQMIVGVAMSNELVGWVLLGLLTGIVLHGGLAVGELVETVVLLGAFLVGALTLGQRAVDRGLRWVLARAGGSVGAMVTANVLVAVAAAVVTQAIGVEAALGAFVGGVVLGRSRYQHRQAVETLKTVTTAVLAPIFFATAGVFVDVGAILTPTRLGWFAGLLVVALVTKFVGAYAGTRMGGRDRATAVAMGVGLNARGTLEIVLATIALTIGAFNAVSYSTVILVAMVSALLTPPLLRAALARVVPAEEEATRLEREEVLAASVIADVGRALVPTRGGENSQLAAQAIDLVLQPEASVTVLTVHPPGQPDEDCVCRESLDAVGAHLGWREVERRRAVEDDPAEAVLKELGLGYGLLALGMTEGYRESRELSPTLRRLLSSTSVPLLLVRHGHQDGRWPREYRRLLVPVVGTRPSRAAEEVAFTLASRTYADLDLVHVISRPDRGRDDALSGTQGPAPGPYAAVHDGWAQRTGTTAEDQTVHTILDQAIARANRFGIEPTGHARRGMAHYEGVQQVADEVDADAIVLSTQVRSVEERPFLGHGTEYLLEHSPQTVLVVVFPADEEPA